MTDTVPVPTFLLRRLWLAVGGAALFMVVATIEGIRRDGYDSWHQAVSALSLGLGGWIQMVNFVVYGVIVTSTAPVWSRILAHGIGARSYPALTGGLGVSFIAVGLVPQDPAPGYDPAHLALRAPTALGLLHLAIAGVAVLCGVTSLLVIANRFARDPQWTGWSRYSRVTALLVVSCVTVYAVWSVRASGFAGTFERFAFVIPIVWTATFLQRLRARTPFMVVPRAVDEKRDVRTVSETPVTPSA
jgi:Protein of unknown function (DUF998)